VDRDRIAAWSEAALAEVDDGKPLECRLRALEGPWPYVELSTAAITWEGEPAAILVATDVTARHQSARLKDELVAMVGHELRDPVTAALGALERVQATPEHTTALVEEAAQNLGDLRALLNDLRDLELAHAGRLELALAPINLVAVLDAALVAFAPTGERSGVWIERVPSPDSLGVLADPVRLAQVVANLLANGVRASARGKVVRVSVGAVGEFARVEVRDEGPAISPALRARVFERFARPAEDARGRGLGLAVSKVIVDEHGGEIGFDTDQEPGTSFWFTVPRAELAGSDL
jgi:signal transduction histidine kinase